MNLKKLTLLGLSSVMMAGFYSCQDDETETTSIPGAFFVSVTGESAEYIMQIDTLDEGSYAISGNVKELESTDYTWIFGDDPSAAIGLIYNQGDPGVGLGFEVNSEGTLDEIGQFQITSRFTNYGFFDKYAVTSVGGKTPVDADGNSLVDDDGNPRTDGVTFNFIDLENDLALTEKGITTLNVTGNGEQATLSGIVDNGNGEFLTALVCSQAKDESETGGSSTGTVNYPDSVWVAAYDADLNLQRIYRDNRISYASGRYRSRYYNMISRADDGNTYVFSGSYDTNSTLPCGALRIKSGATQFDPDYYFNIETLSDGYHFRRLWHITETYFLLVFYNDPEVSASGAASQYGIVNMENKTFSWLGGDFPASDEISDSGEPMAYDGKMYLPVTVSGADPAIYIIDPATANAVKGVTITGASNINAVGHLTAN